MLTFLSRLVEKGLLETEKRGKLRSYTAAMTREAYKNSETRDFLAQLYGGSIQNMVDYALTIQDRAERQRCANTIINIMGNMFPHLRDVPDFKHKLWDHLAIMSGFELDIDYPYEIIRKDNLVTRPEHIPYSTARMRYRHYGHTLEIQIKKAIEFPEGNEKRNLIALICNHMKKDYMAWNKDTVDDRKIAEDLPVAYRAGRLRAGRKLHSVLYSTACTGDSGRNAYLSGRRPRPWPCKRGDTEL